MGCFGYICKGCKTSIIGDCFTGGEKAVLIHVRDGKELGRVEGHYDEYGRVIEQKELPEEEKYRGWHDGINGHGEICDSEFRMKNSYARVREFRIYDGEACNYTRFVKEKIREDLDSKNNIIDSIYYNELDLGMKVYIANLIEQNQVTLAKITICNMIEPFDMKNETKLREEFESLPVVELENYSGTVAWHSLCYNNATENERNDLVPSDDDPNQSWGEVRKEYI